MGDDFKVSFNDIILKATAKAPGDRYQRVSEMGDALRWAAAVKGPPKEVVLGDSIEVVEEGEIERLIDAVAVVAAA